MGRRSKSMLIAGVIGAAAGMVIMNMMNGTNNNRRLGKKSKMMMEGAQRGMFRIGEAGRAAFHEGMEVLRH